jgi:hypothetical protein
MDFNFLIPITLFAIVGYIIKVISDNRLRQKLIDKGEIDENIKFLYSARTEQKGLSSLKWAFVLIGLGLALFIGQIFHTYFTDEMTVGMMFLLAGIGFLIYYFIEKNLRSKSADEKIG